MRVTVLWGPFCAISFAGFLSNFCCGRPPFINTINILQSARLKTGQKRWMLSVLALKWNLPLRGALCKNSNPAYCSLPVVYKIWWKNELLISSNHKEVFFFFSCTFHGPLWTNQWDFVIWGIRMSCTKCLRIIHIRHDWFGSLFFCVLALSNASNQFNSSFSQLSANQVEIIST